MKTLIEQFVTQVLSSTENFTLTDEIHNITYTRLKEGKLYLSMEMFLVLMN